MPELPSYLQNGEILTYEPGTTIYSRGGLVEEKSIYYLVAGLVRLELPSSQGQPVALHLPRPATSCRL